MPIKHAKEKGRRLELKVASLIRSWGLDDNAMRSPGSGAFFGLESDIFTKIPYMLECKNQERVSLWQWWDQAERARKPFKPPVLAVSAANRPVLAIMKFEDWLDMVKIIKDLENAAR